VYAIIRDGGRQYRVSEGDLIEVDLRPASPGTEVTFPEVLLYSDEGGVEAGRPTLPDVEVRGVVEREVKGRKLTVLRFRRRKHSQTRQGHRQRHLAVRITEIARTGATSPEE